MTKTNKQKRKFADFKLKINDEELDFRIYEPTLKDQKNANKVRNEIFAEALTSHAPLRSQLNQMIRSGQKGFDEIQDKQFEDLTREIAEGEKRLAEGGFQLSEAKILALEVQTLRQTRRNMLSEISKLDNNTAEGQADNMAFNYLISACLVYNKEGKELNYFKDLDDYLDNSIGEIAFTAANKLAGLMHNIGEDADKNLPENKFLLDFNFVDDKLRLINKDGKLVDIDGRLVNEDGRFVDESGNFIDKDGNPLTEEGEFQVEFKGFITDDGSVIMGKSHEPLTDKDSKNDDNDDKVDEVNSG